MTDKHELTNSIKNKALDIGFNRVGISKAEEITGYSNTLNTWLNAGYHGKMSYMERNREKRSDPTKLVPGAKSVISLLVSYYPKKLQNKNHPQIAKYAYGTDYHFVLKDKMQQLWDFIAQHFPDLKGRMFADSAPVSDKLWAVKSGLGWIGKNSCLINRELGSFVFICELIVNITLDYDEPYASNFCGSCTKCIDHCPTKAIVQPGVIDSNQCISYQTIENKSDTIDKNLRGKFKNQLFGCDICQDVCPWNHKPLTTIFADFKPPARFYELDTHAWNNMTSSDFNKMFKTSALKRAKFKGIKRNLEFIQSPDTKTE